MENLKDWLGKRSFQVYLLAFGLMTLPPVGMYFAAQNGATGWIWALLAVVVLGNLLVLSIP